MGHPRTPLTAADLDRIDWAKANDGLLPAIVQDATTRQVLMLAWMNRDALAETLDSGEAVFWSRSRRSRWRKGETSGNRLRLVEVLADKSRFSVGPQVLQRCPGDIDRVMDPTFSTTTTDFARLRGALTLARKDDPSLEWLDLLESGGASILGGVGRHATIGHVVLRGGGAHFYAERLAEFFRDRRLLEDDPGLANVRGFSAYGELNARSAGTR